MNVLEPMPASWRPSPIQRATKGLQVAAAAYACLSVGSCVSTYETYARTPARIHASRLEQQLLDNRVQYEASVVRVDSTAAVGAASVRRTQPTFAVRQAGDAYQVALSRDSDSLENELVGLRPTLRRQDETLRLFTDPYYGNVFGSLLAIPGLELMGALALRYQQRRKKTRI